MDDDKKIVDSSLIDDTGVDSSLIDGSGRESDRLKTRRKLIDEVIRSFQESTEDYDGRGSIQAIFRFLKSDGYMGRIPYFDITKVFFTVDDVMRGKMLTNIDKLVEEICSDKKDTILESMITEEEYQNKCREIVLKINDHIHLAYIQMLGITENAVKESRGIFKNELEESKKVFSKEIKQGIQAAEKNSVVILGIFASIITVSIGGFNYVGKVFDAVGNAKNIPALIGLTTIIGIVLISVSAIMINLIFFMVGKKWKWERVIYPSIGVVIAGIVMYLLSYLLPLLPRFFN